MPAMILPDFEREPRHIISVQAPNANSLAIAGAEPARRWPYLYQSGPAALPPASQDE